MPGQPVTQTVLSQPTLPSQQHMTSRGTRIVQLPTQPIPQAQAQTPRYAVPTTVRPVGPAGVSNLLAQQVPQPQSQLPQAQGPRIIRAMRVSRPAPRVSPHDPKTLTPFFSPWLCPPSPCQTPSPQRAWLQRNRRPVSPRPLRRSRSARLPLGRGGRSRSPRNRCWRRRRCSGRPTRSLGRRKHSSSGSWPGRETILALISVSSEFLLLVCGVI